MPEQWYVYIVECRKGAYYTGITTDLNKRVAKHNAGKGAKAVRALGLPVQLVWCQVAKDKPYALRIEAAIKRMDRGNKAALVRGASLGDTVWRDKCLKSTV